MFISGDGTIWTRGGPEHDSPPGTCRLFDGAQLLPAVLSLWAGFSVRKLLVSAVGDCLAGTVFSVPLAPNSLGVDYMHGCGWCPTPAASPGRRPPGLFRPLHRVHTTIPPGFSLSARCPSASALQKLPRRKLHVAFLLRVPASEALLTPTSY